MVAVDALQKLEMSDIPEMYTAVAAILRLLAANLEKQADQVERERVLTIPANVDSTSSEASETDGWELYAHWLA